MGRTRGRKLVLAFVVGAIVLGTVAPAAARPPRFPGVPQKIGPAPSDRCLRVLAIGDSVMGPPAVRIAQPLEKRGYCVRVFDAHVNGTSPPRYWPKELPKLLEQRRPHVVVGEFIGNYYNNSVFPEFVQTMMDATLHLTSIVESAGAIMYWSRPPEPCIFDTPPSQGMREYRMWLRTLPQTRVEFDRIAPGDHFTKRLRVGKHDRIKRVRFEDCVHLTDDGGKLGGRLVASAIQGEWLTEIPVPETAGPSGTERVPMRVPRSDEVGTL